MLILKSPYIRCKGKDTNAAGYMKYIATREHVELLPDDTPATKRQQDLIKKLTRDFPDCKDLREYGLYSQKRTKYYATTFIRAALECNWEKAERSDIYMHYIATRPKVEKIGKHGLFGDEKEVKLENAMAKLDGYTGYVWTHILSLNRGDAERLGYNHASAWRNLLRMHRNDIAKAMQIPAEHFCWYAAFHNEGDHPHVHMMAWSSRENEGRLDRDGIKEIRSLLTKDIYRNDLYSLYEEKSEARDEVVRQAREAMREMISSMKHETCCVPEAEKLLLKLSRELKGHSGKKVYAYLSQESKKTVDDIVDRMAELPAVKTCYKNWLIVHDKIGSFYQEEQLPHKKLSAQKEFRAIKNAVIHEAERLTDWSFEGENLGEEKLGQYPMEVISEEAWRCWNIVLDRDHGFEPRKGAAEELLDLAEEGDGWAQYACGWLYEDGGIFPFNTKKAVQYYNSAAKQGITEASLALGMLYLSDDVDVTDPKEGIKALTIAAESGNQFAAYRLGKEYLTGEHTKKDWKEAEFWLRQAAEKGHAAAEFTLAKLCMCTRPNDLEGAYKYLNDAAWNGNPYARALSQRDVDYQTVCAFLGTCRLLADIGEIFQSHSRYPASDGKQRVNIKHKKDRHQKLRSHKPEDYEGYEPIL